MTTVVEVLRVKMAEPVSTIWVPICVSAIDTTQELTASSVNLTTRKVHV